MQNRGRGRMMSQRTFSKPKNRKSTFPILLSEGLCINFNKKIKKKLKNILNN